MPGTHSALSRHMFTLNGNVLTTGGAKNLAKGQFTIVKSDAPTALGATVVSTGDFAGLPAKQVLEMRLGKHRIPNTRTASNSKPFSSETFKLSDIVDIKKIEPKFQTRRFDELLIGYDGVNPSTAIDLVEGEHVVLDLLLKGDHIGFVTNSCSYPIKFHFSREVGETNQDTIKRAVKSLKALTLTNNVSINEVVDISVIDSSNEALTGIPYTFFNLVVTDAGDSNSLGDIQAQYPNYIVYLTERDGLQSTYTILAPSGTVLADYSQVSVAVADADCDGEAEVTPTEVETAWVAGQTCFATVENYKIQLKDNECGESRLSELQAYYSDLVVAEGAPTGLASRAITLTGTSGTANINIAGVNYLATFATDLATTASNFVTTHASAILTATGAVVTANAGVITVSDGATEFPAISITNATTNLAGTLGAVAYAVNPSVGGCQRVYSTQVVTNIVCDECSPIFLGQFESTAPSDFDFISWELITEASNEDALMGIRIKGKPFDIIPTDISRDQIPFYETSTRVEASGGYIVEVNESYQNSCVNDCRDLFAVTRLSRAQDRDNLGGYLMSVEEASRAYFDGEVRHPDNMYARAVLGEESVLDFTKQYVQYAITIHDNKYSQGVGRRSDMGTTYNVWAELGKEVNLDAYLGALATKVGMPF